jgi:phosphoribosylformylglycinamidine synthase PurS subunit
LSKVKIYITYKKGILDPQGTTVAKALSALNYDNVGSVRIGKYIQMELAENDSGRVEEQVAEMCQRLLANPVIEDYSFEVVKE